MTLPLGSMLATRRSAMRPRQPQALESLEKLIASSLYFTSPQWSRVSWGLGEIKCTCAWWSLGDSCAQPFSFSTQVDLEPSSSKTCETGIDASGKGCSPSIKHPSKVWVHLSSVQQTHCGKHTSCTRLPATRLWFRHHVRALQIDHSTIIPTEVHLT